MENKNLDLQSGEDIEFIFDDFLELTSNLDNFNSQSENTTEASKYKLLKALKNAKYLTISLQSEKQSEKNSDIAIQLNHIETELLKLKQLISARKNELIN